MSLPSSSQNAVHAAKCELASEVLRVSGKLSIRVNGWSMLPAIWSGDVLLIETLTGQDVTAGQVVIFERDGRLFVHRVLAEDAAYQAGVIRTRGDAMPHADPPISRKAVLGRVQTIVRNGKTIEAAAKLGLWQRGVAALSRSSDFAARLIIATRCLQQRMQSAS